MGVQHRVARFHLKRFMSPRHGEGRLFIYSNRCVPPIGLRPIRDIACFDKRHSDAVEKEMTSVEAAAAPILQSLDGSARRFEGKHLAPLIDYIALLAVRNLDIERRWESQLQAIQIANPYHWDEIEQFREASLWRSALLKEMRPWLRDLMRLYPYWETLTPLGQDDEYIVSDTPALISVPMDRTSLPKNAGVIMPVGKKTVLIGCAGPSVIHGIDFCSWSVNGMLVAYSQKELYSHRKLDPDHLARWILLAPFIRLVCHSGGPQAFLQVECSAPLRRSPK
jgi:hypothetical protein